MMRISLTTKQRGQRKYPFETDISSGPFVRGLNGGVLSVGPGVGISGSTGNTWTLSPNAILRALGLKDD